MFTFTLKQKIGLFLLSLVSLMALALFVVSEPIAQDTAYHHFADSTQYFSIQNALNVLSNLPFIVIGASFVKLLLRRKMSGQPVNNHHAFLWLFIGCFFVGLGSAYYHYNPNNMTLVWDRLPMAIAFMSLFVIALSDHFASIKSEKILWPLIAIGIFSVAYWWYGESLGQGDLRIYLLVQFLPMLMIPILLLFFDNNEGSKKAFWVLLGLYVIAKFFELLDAEVHHHLVYLSGHSIKHLVAALGLYYFGKLTLVQRSNKRESNKRHPDDLHKSSIRKTSRHPGIPKLSSN
ncbi:ceramidase domain-containing protein [Pleionea sp. CnH1-48]|uniref:ceramidase domain-containing protein n=1 Tax=Pleionea sp. CnH1-48 TaxID=2954494 RepID=UPI002097E5BA|nr:ceramidase domain-containing protein [Pleionea sp. CnH1-48]MCO7224252.1 ceramidase [Pleionea sp. CnH1-48]